MWDAIGELILATTMLIYGILVLLMQGTLRQLITAVDLMSKAVKNVVDSQQQLSEGLARYFESQLP